MKQIVRNVRMLALAGVVVCGLGVVRAETHRTLDWLVDTGNWDVAANWKDVAGGTNAVPRDGDILNIKYKTNGQNSNNNLTGLKLYRLNIPGGFQWVKGNELVFLDGSYGIHNEGFMYVATPLAIEGTNVTIDATSFNVFAWNANGKAITSYDGKPCGIVKTGSGNAGSQPNDGNYDFTGFKYITVKAGNWCFNVNGNPNSSHTGNVYPPNVDFIFANSGTGLMIGGNVTISGLTLFETGTAVGGSQEIRQQGASNYGTLTITGSPSVDRQVFTGKVTGGTGFVWAPDSSAKEFVFKGGVSSNTGKLGVRNGTLRLSDGASFTALSELEVSGGAKSAFIIETLPSKTFKTAKLTIGTGAESVSLPAGMTLEVELATVNGARLRPGAYSRANATWLTGDGTVTVTGIAQAQTLVWCGEGGDGLWSNPQNWTNAETGAHDAPYPGDMLNLATAGSVTVDLAGGTTFTTPSLALGLETVLSVPAGVTLDATNALRGFTRVAPDSYAGCDWVTGGGAVRVEAMASCHLKWSGGGGSNKNWSNAANWVNQTTMQPDVPQNGDTLTLASGGGSQTLDMPNFKPYRLNIPGGYSDPRSSSPLIFEEGSWGIYNQGYMYVYTPIVVRAKKVTMYCSQTGGYADGFYNDQGNTFGFEKTGPGVFAFKTGASSYNLKFTGLKDIVITEGGVAFGWQKTGQMKWFEPGIEVTFNGANTSLKFDQTTTFTNFVIRETANAIGKVHNINEEKDGSSTVGTPKTFTIAGAPALSPMTFTGDILSPMSFGWAPDNATNEFVFVGQEVTCTNTITAAGGVMRLTDGASFTKLGTLELKGGAKTAFVVDTAPAKTFHVKNLVLETGLETLCAEGGVKLAFDTLTVAGETMPAGVYVRTGRVGVQVPWAAGNGYICVGGADMPDEPSGEAVAANWTALGADTEVGTAQNWSGAVLPDLDSGLVAATFAAGAGADLDLTAKFKSIALDAPGNWAFTASNPNVFAYLGSGGLTTAGTGKTYAFGWPIFLWGDQTWNLGAGDKIVLNGNLDSAGCTLTLNGGTIDCNVPISHSGPVDIAAGTVNLNADDALGSSSHPVALDPQTTTLNFRGVTVNRSVKVSNPSAGGTPLHIYGGAKENVLNGDLDLSKDTGVNLSFHENSILRVKGHLRRGTTAWCYFNGPSSGTGTLELDAPTLMDAQQPYSAFGHTVNMTVCLNAPSNELGGVWYWIQGNNGRLRTTVPYAIHANGRNRIRDTSGYTFTWDLCGCDQSINGIGLVSSSKFTLTSATPATLHLPFQSSQYQSNYYETTNGVMVTGAASVSYEGKDGTFLQFSGESSSTGVVQVVSGRLEFGAGRWPNATAAVVKGGEMKFFNRKALGKTTAVRFEGTTGTMNLAYTGSMNVKSLSVGGEELPEGVYGSAASGAPNVLDRLTGTGRLRVGQVGLYLLIR